MKKCLFYIVSVLALFSLISCSGLGGSDGKKITAIDSDIVQALRNAESEVGDVNKVFTANGARFYSGQIIDNAFGFGEAIFFGELVEYNCLNQTILGYIESLETCNAMMHQNYPGQHYDASKKYVEFSSYTNTSTKEVIAFEVRIFWGNFMNSTGWYAKSVTFSPDLKIDMYANKNIETNEYAYYWGTNGNDGYGNGNSVVTHEVPSGSYPAVLSQLGTLSKVYAEFDEWDCIQSSINGDGYKITTYYAEYTELQQSVISYFENQSFGLCRMWSGHDVTEDHSKKYIEYTVAFDVSDNSFVFYDLRYLADWNRKECGDDYCKQIRAFQEDLDYLNYDSVYDYFTYQGAQRITDYPAVLNKLGDLSRVCDCDTGPCYEGNYVSYYAEYESLKTEVVDVFPSDATAMLHYGYNYTENPHKKYIEYIEYMTNGSVTRYELRYVADPTKIENHGENEWYAKEKTIEASALASGQNLYDYICAHPSGN